MKIPKTLKEYEVWWETLNSDPAKSWYVTIVSASQQIMRAVQDKTLDIKDPYTAAILELLEKGEKMGKTIKAAKVDAFGEIEEEETSLIDRRRNG